MELKIDTLKFSIQSFFLLLVLFVKKLSLKGWVGGGGGGRKTQREGMSERVLVTC